MTRKHFEAIAAALAESKPGVWGQNAGPDMALETPMTRWARTCHNVADRIAPFNEAFNREKFLEACGCTS